MKKKYLLQEGFLTTFLLLSSLFVFSQNNMRIKENFDFDWKFHLGDVKEASLPNYNDRNWKDIQLPHDWSIELPVDSTLRRGSMGFFQGGIGWYRKTFDIPEIYKGRKITLLFDGIYLQSDVYINGKHLGFYPYGYIGFEYDITPYLNFGKENTVSVRVDHSNCPSSRWYSGSGIYRHVWLNILNPIHIPNWGTYVSTPKITKESADIKIATDIENYSSPAKKIILESIIKDAGGNRVGSTIFEVSAAKKGKTNVSQSLSVKNPVLWSIDQPYLYCIESVLKIDGKIIDHYETPFGIRDLKFDPDKGFFLNGRNMKIKGMNLHQDAGCLGTAVPDRSYERRLKILKEFGCNAIRCSHNPPSPEFLDLCDKLGFLVIDEAFDKWKGGYYGEYFDQWWQKDLDAMIRRDRNHPSIMLWSIGNEVGEQGDTTQVGVERLKMLRDYVHKAEPTRKVTMALMPGDRRNRVYNKTGFADAPDVIGYNYMEPFFIDDHEQFPKRIIFGTEVFPYYRSGKEQQREYHEINPWYDTAHNDFIFGYFIWAGVDYLGESSGWPSKGWPTCPFDICMFEKPFAAFLKSVWNEDKPMVSIAIVDQSLNLDPGKDNWSWPNIISHWTFPQYKGQIIHVQTMTNCEEVEVWVNGVSVGRRKTDDFTNNTINWRVPYHEGVIQAKGYNKSVEVASFEMHTAKKPIKIDLVADKESINADGQDLSHIAVRLIDENGNLVPIDDRKIEFSIQGQGKLVGIANGDLRNNESFKSNSHTTYFGKMLAIVQSGRQKGDIIVAAKAEGLPLSTVTITCR